MQPPRTNNNALPRSFGGSLFAPAARLATSALAAIFTCTQQTALLPWEKQFTD